VDSFATLATKVKYRGITIKFILLILLFTIITTIFSTIVQIHFEYQRDLDLIEKQIEQIEKSYFSSLAASIWDVDKEELNIQLLEILKLPNVEKVKFRNPNDSRDDLETGKVKSKHLLEKTFPIKFLNTSTNEWKILGEISIAIGLDDLRDNTAQLGKGILLVETIKFFLLGLLVLLAFQNLITRHLKKITEFTSNLSNIEYLKNKLILNRNPDIVDEFSLIAAATNGVTEKLYHYTTNLQNIIEEKSKNISYILDNIQQGIFTILPNNKIHQEYSKYLEVLFETKELAGQDVMDIIFRNCHLTPEVLSKQFRALVASIGEESINFEMHADSFVKEIRRDCTDGGHRILTLEWMPIVNQNKITEKIMVIVRNVTELRELQETATKREKETEVITEILSNSSERFQYFTTLVTQIIDRSNEFIKNLRYSKNKAISEYLKEMITGISNVYQELKAVARDYNLFSICANIIDAEKIIEKLKNDYLQNYHSAQIINSSTAEEVTLQILKLHKNITSTIYEYIEINEKKLGRSTPDKTELFFRKTSILSPNLPTNTGNADLDDTTSQTGQDHTATIEIEIKNYVLHDAQYSVPSNKYLTSMGQISVNPEGLKSQIERLRMLQNSNIPFSQKSILQETYIFLNLIGHDKLENIISCHFYNLATLSKQLKKLPPKIVIHDPGIFIKNHLHLLLQNLLNHLFRNSIDHGFEPESERTSKGKEPSGTIEIDLIAAKQHFIIRYRDDGRGLDLLRIKQVGIQKGIFSYNNIDYLSLEEICNAVFTQEFSTAKKVTNISGRGIGMDASKKIIQDLQGEIKIILGNAPIKESGYYPFEIIISLPRDSILVKNEI
ncbi:MAG: hypothetical protein HQK53_06255, partial [Oligoflexia bacterium]|nr:hypothetical protein [Oligoflexia bacterium]